MFSKVMYCCACVCSVCVCVFCVCVRARACALCQFASGWVYGEQLCENAKVHPLLKPYRALAEKVKWPPLLPGQHSVTGHLLMYIHAVQLIE